jgi:membrane protease YdiL (CAAX protease family)
MTMVFAMFVPFILIALVANLTELNQRYRWITSLLLALSNLLVLLSALLVLLMRLAYEVSDLALDALPFEPQWEITALVLGLTGLAGFIPLVPAVRRWLARGLKIDPESTVHTTALVFAVYLLGLTMAQLPMLGGLEGLENLDVPLGQQELWLQALALLLFGVIGVGLGLRRGMRETSERLGLRWPSWRAWVGVVAIVVLLQALDYGVATAWNAVDPVSYERIGRVSEALFGGFMSPWGALAVGIAAGLSEETLFRGALQPRFGMLLTSLLFALSHIQYGFSPAILVVWVIGLVLGWVRKRWGLVAAIAIHALYNMVNLLLASLWP